MRGGQAGEALLAFGLLSEHAHVYPRVAQVGGRFDSGHRDKSYAWVLKAFGDSG
jgi:hypothetical protein